VIATILQTCVLETFETRILQQRQQHVKGYDLFQDAANSSSLGAGIGVAAAAAASNLTQSTKQPLRALSNMMMMHTLSSSSSSSTSSVAMNPFPGVGGGGGTPQHPTPHPLKHDMHASSTHDRVPVTSIAVTLNSLDAILRYTGQLRHTLEMDMRHHFPPEHLPISLKTSLEV
jgi:hypothetical protein